MFPFCQGELAGLVGASRKRVNQVMVAFKWNSVHAKDVRRPVGAPSVDRIKAAIVH